MNPRLSALSLLLTIAACNGAPPPPATSDGGTPPTPGRDGGPTIPNAARIDLDVTPGRAVYRTQSNVRIVPNVTDAMGAVIADPVVTFTVTPSDAAMELEPGRYRLLREGNVKFTGCTPRPGGRAPICDDANILVDSGAPTLVVDSPRPGDELGGDGATRIVVRGSVMDTRTSVVFVNGQRVMVDAMGAFTTEVVPFFGVNHLEIVASDAVTEEARIEMDVLWAEGYLPATDGTKPSVTLPEGVALQLGQTLFDDGNRIDTSMRPLVTQDIADALQLVVESLDARAVLPANPLVGTPGSSFFLNVDAVTISSVTVQLDVVDGGLELFLRIGRLRADTTGQFKVTPTSTPLDLTGGVSAIASAYARIDVRKDAPDQPVQTTLRDFTVAIEAAEGEFQSNEANAVFRFAQGLLRTTLETQLRTAFDQTLRTTLPQLLGSVFTALDTALQNRTIPLRTALFPPIDATLDARIATLTTSYRNNLRASLRAKVETNATTLSWPMSRGVASTTATPSAPPFFVEPRLQLGLRLTLLNALLHVLWNSGLLKIDATPALPPDVRGLVQLARIDGKLPPVLRLPRPFETYDLMLTLGQLELDTVVMGEAVRFGLTVEAGIDLSVANNRVQLTIAETPALRIWTIQSTTSNGVLTPALLRALVLEQLWPQLRASFATGLSLDLPIPSLGDLTSLAPALAGFQLGLEVPGNVELRSGFLVLEGSLTGRLN